MRKDVLSMEETRFYVAQTVLALEAIHKHNYIHRWASCSVCGNPLIIFPQVHRCRRGKEVRPSGCFRVVLFGVGKAVFQDTRPLGAVVSFSMLPRRACSLPTLGRPGQASGSFQTIICALQCRLLWPCSSLKHWLLQGALPIKE
jgi:hypothetical protein